MTSTPDTDAELLGRAARGDTEALTSLYDRHARALFAFLCRLTADEATAEDLLQDAFLAAWRGARSFRGDSSVRTWLFGVAHHKAMHHLRRSDRSSVDGIEIISDTGPAVSELAEGAWVQERVLTALAELPPAQRAVLELVFYFGLSCAEVAEVLDCPVGTVKSWAYLARRKLAGLLGGIPSEEE
jgi:RNA polymerase sigma factor (sigma-70 family)